MVDNLEYIRFELVKIFLAQEYSVKETISFIKSLEKELFSDPQPTED